jgi:hypothetical protein
MCQAITASLRATATVAMLRPRREATRWWKTRSGPVVRAACQAASTSTWRASPGALLGDSAVPGWFRSRLAHPRVEAEVADQLPSGREAPDVADCGQQRAGGHEVDAGERQQPAQLGRGEHELGERLIDRHHLAVEEVDPTQAGLDHLPLVNRQLLSSQPAATGGTEQVRCRRPLLQVTDQDRVHLVLLAGALPHQLRAA